MTLLKPIDKDIILTDFIISVGIACRPAYYLNHCNLRFCSSPLDWMMSYSLNTVVKLFKTDFDDFFKEKLEHSERVELKYRCVEDILNEIVSVHSFPSDKDIDEVYDSFVEVMKKRYFRMRKLMSDSKHITFISNRNEPLENFESFLHQISQIIDCNITYINVYNDITSAKFEKQINQRLKFIQYTFNDVHPDGTTTENPKFWLGNPDQWKTLMGLIKLTDKHTSQALQVRQEDAIQR